MNYDLLAAARFTDTFISDSLSGSGDWWSVNLDVGDLGVHLGPTDS